MLSLSPASTCDVCAEEYGPTRLPHSMPCGHVLCAACCQNIVDKSPPRIAPNCPFCREPFVIADVRKIRIDFAPGLLSSGRSTPWRPIIESNEHSFAKDEEIILVERTAAQSPKADVRRLEDKVGNIAKKRCSVEEVLSLQKEITSWSITNKHDVPASLSLSAALLHAIITNYHAHEHANKNAKAVESGLRVQIDDLTAQVRRQEQEMMQLRGAAVSGTLHMPNTTTSASSVPLSPQGDPRLTKSAATSPLNSPPMVHSIPLASPLPGHGTPTSPPSLARSKSSVAHARVPSSTATSLLFRAETPTARSHTPTIRSHTPAPATLPRMHTPGPMARAGTPMSTASAANAVRAVSPPPPLPTQQTPNPSPRKPGVPAHSAPTMLRSTSDDERAWDPKEASRAKSPGGVFTRWVPGHSSRASVDRRGAATPGPTPSAPAVIDRRASATPGPMSSTRVQVDRRTSLTPAPRSATNVAFGSAISQPAATRPRALSSARSMASAAFGMPPSRPATAMRAAG